MTLVLRLIYTFESVFGAVMWNLRRKTHQNQNPKQCHSNHCRLTSYVTILEGSCYSTVLLRTLCLKVTSR